MKIYYFLLPLVLLMSCGETEDDTVTTDDDSTEVTSQSDAEFNARAKREVSGKLAIPANEKYTIQVYREYINSDTIMDAIVTVNRLEYAMDEAIKSGKQAKKAETGFMGNYNFFFYYDGALDKFSVPLPVPSSPGRPLDVSFQHILSETSNDVVIGYRVLNSGYLSYFSVFNESDLALVFQWKQFDKIGDQQPEAFIQKAVSTPNSHYKDICIYQSEIDGYSTNIGDIYTYVPQITKQGTLLYQFTFDPRFGKFKLIGGSEYANTASKAPNAPPRPLRK